MRAEIRVSATDSIPEYSDLFDWLRGQRALAGVVSAVYATPGESELGGAFELLAVALGSGGTAVALVNALAAWLPTRRPDVKITITSDAGGRVEIDARRIKDADAVPMLREVLGIKDGS
jgi:Effector Associated Constant Component 1